MCEASPKLPDSQSQTTEDEEGPSQVFVQVAGAGSLVADVWIIFEVLLAGDCFAN